MGFTEEQTAKRAKAQAKQARAAAKVEAERLAREHELDKLKERLGCEYPDVPTGDALQLWSIASCLTTDLIGSYESGAAKLRASTLEWKSLFYELRPVDGNRKDAAMTRRYPSRSQRMLYGPGNYRRCDKGYAAVLTAMARSIQDIGQTFRLRDAGMSSANRDRRNPKVEVVCTAPCPD